MVTDNFTGSNGTSPPSGNWTNITNGMQIQSNRAVGTVDVAVNLARYTGVAVANDHYSQGVLYHGGTSRALLCVRMQAGGDFYYVDFNVDAGTAQMAKRVSGSFTNIGSSLVAPTAGLVYKLEVIGTSLKLYESGVQVGSTQTDSDIASGSYGIGSITSTEGWDDFEGADIGGGGSSAALLLAMQHEG